MLKKVNWNVTLGKEGEDLAGDYLTANGFRILEERFRTRFGEIDIIASKQGEFFFVEVKTRSDRRRGKPIEQFPFYRVERLKKMALFYAARKRLLEKNLHLSLLGIDLSQGAPEISFIKDIVE